MIRRSSLASRASQIFVTGMLLATVLPAPVAATPASPSGGSAPIAAVPIPAPNLVENPSFETPLLDGTDQAFTAADAFPSWTLTGKAYLVRCIDPGCSKINAPWAAQEGAQSVDIATTQNTGTLTQLIPTPIGHTFTLSFWYLPGPRANLDTKADAKANIQWAGSKVPLALVDRAAGAENVWQFISFPLPVAVTAQTLLSFKGIAGRNFGFAIDNVSVVDDAGGTPDPDQVAPPELYRAAPPYSAGGFDFSKMRILGLSTYDLGTYELSFFAAESCDAMDLDLPPVATWTLTKSTADATPVFVTDELAATISPSTPFIAAKVTGPASTPGVDGKVSGFSNCVVYGPENDTWTRALDISGSLTAELGNWIDEPGIGRWFKVDVAPGGSVTVDLRSLPEDFDIYLFKDIRETYDQLTTETDLVKLNAEFAGSGFSGSGFSGSGFSGSGFSGSGFSGSGFSADTYSGSGFSGSGFSGSGFSGSGFSGSGFSGSGFSGSGFSAEDFSAAQYYSLIGWSNNIGTADEQVGANTWTSTGDFYMRVNGKNGVSSLASPFDIDLTVDSNVCNIVSASGSAPGPIANAFENLILTDTSRFSGDTSALQSKLAQLATATNGTAVDFAGPGRVADLNNQADLNPACVYAKNLVASAMKDVVDAYRAGNPGLKYIVLAGGDSVIPFFRYPDTASLAPEMNFYPPVAAGTASEASLRANYVLGQDGYGSTQTISVGPVDFPVPGIPVGRLVEDPSEIIGMVDAYLSLTPSGSGERSVSPASSLVTGYDFVADTAVAVKVNLDAGTGEAGGGDSLMQPNGKAPTDEATNWTADELKALLLGQRHDITFLAGHFSANSALASDYASVVTTADVDASLTNFVNTILFSIGCHSGYNIVNGDAGLTTNPLDWPQVFARKGITSILGTGYQYGDTDFLEYSERIYSEFSKQLLYGAVGDPVAIGNALVAAKVAYLQQTYNIADLHLKSLLEAGLYGLPMLGVDFENGRLGPPPVGTGSLTLTPAATGLKYVDLTKATTESDLNTKPLLNGDTTDPEDTLPATWYSGPAGVHTEPGAPALPLYATNVTPDNTNYVLRGVGFRGGTFQDFANIIPLSGAPATELQTAHTSFNSPVFYPSQMWTPNYWGLLTGGNQTGLSLTPAQHKATQPGSPYVQLRLYSELALRLFYIDETAPGITALAPVINGVTSSLVSGDVSARVIGDPAAGIHAVWVTYTEPSSGAWQSFDLDQDAADTAIWRATADPNLKPGTLFMVQAVNGAGTISVNDNFGAYYLWGVDATDLEPTALTLSGPSSGTYGTTATVTATLTTNGNPVVGGLVILALGGVTRSGTTTGPDGTVDIVLPVSAAAGVYAVAGSFLGDATYGSSGASQPFTITKADSVVTVSCTSSVTYTGAAQVPCTAQVTGTTPFDDLDQPLVVTYSNNTDPGIDTATASAAFPGDAAHNPSSDSENFTIGPASSTTVVTCTGGPFTYTASAQTPCSATVTGVGLSLAPTPDYANNTNAGTATASYTFAGDATHTGSTDSENFTIGPASATCSITGYNATYDGNAHGATGSCVGIGEAPLTGLNLGASFTDAPGGTANWTFTDPAGNYASTGGSVDIMIAKRTLSVSAVAASKTYGASDPAFTWTYSGFVGGENAGNVTINGSASCTRAAGETVGSYAITCTPGSLSAANYSFITGSTASFTIGKVPGRVEYTGQYFAAINTAPTLSMKLVTDNTINYGAITVNAVFKLYRAGCTTSSCPTAATFTSGNIRVTGTGTATVTGPNSLAEGAYLVVVTVNTNDYILPDVARSTLTVGSPSGTFATGGGSIATDAGYFGFAVKGGKAPSGNAIYVYRARINVITGAACAAIFGDCRDADVIVRSTSVSTLSITRVAYPLTAFIIGKATVQFVYLADGTVSGGFSGADFRIDAYDWSSPTSGSGDKFGFTLYRTISGTTTVFHQASIGAINQTGTAAVTNQVVISAGNISIHQ